MFQILLQHPLIIEQCLGERFSDDLRPYLLLWNLTLKFLAFSWTSSKICFAVNQTLCLVVSWRFDDEGFKRIRAQNRYPVIEYNRIPVTILIHFNHEGLTFRVWICVSFDREYNPFYPVRPITQSRQSNLKCDRLL